ncbi:MAG: hypothetical protein H6721_03080 [Sandaracinus sp.]|nr:hypothetical protein [Sandaracinus sp.]
MTKNHTMGWLLLCAAVACGRSDADREEFERFMREGEAQANAAVEAAAARAAEPPAAITLAEVTVPDMGVAMKIPEGARTLAASAASTTYSLPLAGGLHEINVQVLGFSEDSLEGARRAATMLGGTVAEANPTEGGFEVVLAPQGVLQTVHAFAAGKSAKCTGPRDRLALLREVCGSLRPAS